MPNHRHEKPLKDLTPLERVWEEKLRLEGLGERSLFDYSPSDQVRFVSTDAIEKALNTGTRPDGDAADAETLSYALNGGQIAWHDHPTAALFRNLGAAIHRLPTDWSPRARAFLLDYAETGNMALSARNTNVPKRSARRYLAAFNTYAKAAKTAQFPKPCDTRRRAA